MLVRNKQSLSLGIVFSLTFLGVLLLIFSPVFKGQNGLKFADESFNKLAKGSSYFIPKVSKSVEEFEGRQFAVTIVVDKKETIEPTVRLFETAGAAVKVDGEKLYISGDLGAVLRSALEDADYIYNNNGSAVFTKYNYDEKATLKNWWTAFGKMEKRLKKAKSIQEANVISEVNKKAIEPAYNFYQLDGERVVDHVGMMSGLLVFYVAYTMWWGFAIYYVFEGIGLTMKKAKVKKEA